MDSVLIITSKEAAAPEKLSEPLPTHFRGNDNLIKSFQKFGVQVDNMRLDTKADIEKYQINLDKYDLVLNRFVSNDAANSYLEQKALQNFLKKSKVINSFAGISFSQNKMICFKKFYRAGINTPMTIHAKSIGIQGFSKFFKGKIVVKPTSGANADQVRFLESIDEVIPESGIIVQPQIDTKACYRVIVCQKVISIYQKNTQGLLHHGIDSNNRLAEEDPLYKPLSTMALEMTKNTNLFYSGVDILVNQEGILYGLEINYSPGIPLQDDSDQIALTIINEL